MLSSPDEMTPAWFQEVFTNSGVLGAATVASAEVAQIGGGAFGRMIRAELTYDGATDAPASVVVKVPTEDAGSLAVAQGMSMYELEVQFYREIAPLLPDFRAPVCYHAELDGPANFVLVLEDLSETTKPGDVLSASTLDECALALEQLVYLQAPTWNSKAIADLPWIADPARTHGVFTAMSGGLQPFLDRFGHGLEPEHVELFEKVMPHSGQWARSWQAPTVVQHGDFRADNVMFGIAAGASPATIIDFQTIRLGPPGMDPAYFTGSSLPTEERRAAERDLIEDYHRRLVAAGVDGFDFDACWKAYREGSLYGVCMFVGMAAGVVADERIEKVILNQSRRYADMAVDLEALDAAGLA